MGNWSKRVKMRKKSKHCWKKWLAWFQQKLLKLCVLVKMALFSQKLLKTVLLSGQNGFILAKAAQNFCELVEMAVFSQKLL